MPSYLCNMEYTIDKAFPAPPHNRFFFADLNLILKTYKIFNLKLF